MTKEEIKDIIENIPIRYKKKTMDVKLLENIKKLMINNTYWEYGYPSINQFLIIKYKWAKSSASEIASMADYYIDDNGCFDNRFCFIKDCQYKLCRKMIQYEKSEIIDMNDKGFIEVAGDGQILDDLYWAYKHNQPPMITYTVETNYGNLKNTRINTAKEEDLESYIKKLEENSRVDNDKLLMVQEISQKINYLDKEKLKAVLDFITSIT